MRSILGCAAAALLTVLATAQGAPPDRGTLPAVSPDGAHVAYLSKRSDKTQVFVARVDGTHERQLTTSPEEKNAPHWLDRRTVMFSVPDGDGSRLIALDLKGKHRREMGRVPGRNPIPSPDGKQVIYMVGPWTATRFVRAGLHNENARQLTDGSSTTWTPAWSPDGKEVAFTRSDDKRLNVWVMTAEGDSPRRVSDAAQQQGDAQFPAWAPDGKRLAFQLNAGPKGSRTAHIWVIDLAAGTARKLSAHEEAYLDETPSWFPDGTRIAFQSNRNGVMEIWTMKADGSDPRKLTQ